MSNSPRPSQLRWFGLCAALATIACDGQRSDDSTRVVPPDERQNGSESPIRALTVTELTIDAAAQPRDGNGLIAGENARIGLRITGGQPPYRGVIRSQQIGAVSGAGQVMLIDAEFQPDAPADGKQTSPDAPSDAIEIGIRARLDRRALTGVYQVSATVTDATGREATTNSGDVSIIGDDAQVLPAPTRAPYVEVLDAAGRRRRSFVRGEPVAIRVKLPGADQALIALRDPSGILLAETTLPTTASGEVIFPLSVPRLAQLGAHEIIAQGQPRQGRATGALEVQGRSWAPIVQLQIDAMAIYGGRDGQAPRAVILRRGEALVLEARIGGGQQRVGLSVRLSGHVGVVSEADLGQTPVARPSAMTRIYARGPWTVPEKIPVGRYQMQLQATEGDRVSVRSREVIIR